MEVFIGKEAPDFKAEAYHQESIKEIKLSDYRGRWALLLFYPADFTSV
jgi:peroxiredoxin (alkyl hydroperoxide reductase subunit C)